MRTTRRQFVTAAIIGTTAIGLAPHAFAQVSGKKYRIAFANYSDEAVFGAAVLQGMRQGAKARPNVEILYFDNRQDAAKSIENARTILAAKPDLVLWYSTFSDVNVRVGALFKEASLPVIAVQSPVPGAPMFAVDNKLSGDESGKAAAQEFKKRWPSEVPQVLILGWPEQGPLFTERADAAKKAILAVLPNAKLSEFSTTGDPNRARQLTADFLTRNPGAKGIVWAHVDAMGVSALAAARNGARDSDLVIATTGGDKSVFTEIRKAGGPFIGTFSFFPDFWGQDLIDLAIRRLGGESLPDRIAPRKQLFITGANINEYYPQ